MLVSDIKQYKIGETYIKFDFDFNENNKEIIKRAYIEYVRRKENVELKNWESLLITIEFDKGSLKTKITLWGAIATLYMGIANYGSFRSGVREIIKDIKCVSEVTVNKIQDAPQIDNHHVIRFERRLGIPGRLNDIYRRIDDFQKRSKNYSPKEFNDLLNSIKQEIADIIVILDDNTRQRFLSDLSKEFGENLPAPNPVTTNFLYNKYALKPDDNIEILNE